MADTVRDSNGNELKDGDSVTLIKDLKVKGANITLKRGTMIKGIRLTGNSEEVDCRHEKVKGRDSPGHRDWSPHRVKWNGEVRLTDQVLIQYSDNSYDMNRNGEQLKLFANTVHGYLPGERRFGFPIIFRRRRAPLLVA